MYDVHNRYVPKKQLDRISFSQIQNWILNTREVSVSKSSISMVKAKCGIDVLVKGSEYSCIPELTSEKEKLVLEAFQYHGIII